MKCFKKEKKTVDQNEEQELTKLASVLSKHEQAEREKPAPEFRQSMEERIASGFKTGPAQKEEKRFLSAVLNPLKAAGAFFDRVVAGRGLAFGGAAAVLVALAVSITVLQDSGDRVPIGPTGDNKTLREQPSGGNTDEKGSPEGRGQSFAQKEKSSEDRASGEIGGGIIAPEPPSSDSRIAPKERERKVEQSAELTLEVGKGSVEKAANDVIRVSDRNRGVVMSTNISTGKEGSGQATFDLRVPTDRLAKTLRELSELGSVVLRTQSGLDITQSFVDARDQLQEARAERKSLLKQLANASTPQKADAIKRKLEIVKSRISSLKGQLKSLHNRTDFARIDVTVQEENGSSGSSDTQDAFDDSLDFIVGVLNFAIRVFAVLLVIAIVAASIVLPVRWIRKRRRDSTLS